MRRLPGRVALLVAIAALSPGVAGQVPTFRATSDAVLVDVSVTAGNQPVADMKASDFGLMDNGQPQQIDEVGFVTLPIDLTLLVDTGSEARFVALSRVIQHGAQSIRGLLQTGDRGSLVTVDSQMRWGAAPEDPSLRGERGTMLFDAICAAVMSPVDPGRRHLIVVVTAGIDAGSLIPSATREQILAKSESPVFVVTGPPIPIEGTYVGGRNGGPASERPTVALAPGVQWMYGSAYVMGDYSGPLRAIADATGGRVFDLRESNSFVEPLRRAFEDFRTRYVLRYRPHDVSTVGWHTLAVKMNRAGSFNVKARRGYWRD